MPWPYHCFTVPSNRRFIREHHWLMKTPSVGRGRRGCWKPSSAQCRLKKPEQAGLRPARFRRRCRTGCNGRPIGWYCFVPLMTISRSNDTPPRWRAICWNCSTCFVAERIVRATDRSDRQCWISGNAYWRSRRLAMSRASSTSWRSCSKVSRSKLGTASASVFRTLPRICGSARSP